MVRLFVVMMMGLVGLAHAYDPAFMPRPVQSYEKHNAALQNAIDTILDSYGDIVRVKPKSLLKFGRNDVVGSTRVMIWQNGTVSETLATTNSIDTISSAATGDTQAIYLEGHTVSGTGINQQFSFVTQTVTLNGRNKVSLTTPVARASRAYNTSSTYLSGSVYVYEDTGITNGVPNNTSQTHLVIIPTEQQTLKAATTFSNNDYAAITKIYGSVNKKTAASVDIRLEIRAPGGVWRTQFTGTTNTAADGSFVLNFDPYYIVPKNHDVRLTAEASTSNVSVSAGFHAYILTTQF